MKAFLTFSCVGLVLVGTVSSAEVELSSDEAAELTPQQVRDTVRLVLRREATAENAAERAGAIRDLSKLYVGIVRDDDMAEQSRLKLKAKVYSRLIQVKEDLQRNVDRHKEDPDAKLPRYPTSESLANDQSARGGGTVADYGETLVELIQHVISPDHWDVNGGPGSIVYYPNLKVLVVRASGDAHGRVGGLFDGLRRP